MKRPLIFVSLLVVVAIALGASLFLGEGAPADERQDLAERIETAVENASPGDTVVLDMLLPIGFDFVGVITPYADNAAVARVMGIDWDAQSAPAYRADGLVELVFVDGNRVVAWCQLNRSRVDFSVFDGPFRVDAPGAFRVRAATAPLGKLLVPVNLGSLAPAGA